MPDSRSLFRPEALEAQRQQWLGRVQLVRPLSLRVLTAGVVLVAVSLVAFLSLAQYTRKSTAAGVLVPDRGLIRLVPAAAGTVLERRISEGQISTNFLPVSSSRSYPRSSQNSELRSRQHPDASSAR